MMKSRTLRLLSVVLSLALFTAACGSDDDNGATDDAANTTAADSGDDAAKTSAEICSADELVEAVESGPEEGTLMGMTDDPVANAASSNPVLTTLVTAVKAAGLVDTLNNAESLTVFAPTDCAFSKLDKATLEAALADPEGLLTQVLGFHVIAGDQLEATDLESKEYKTFTGAMLPVEVDGDTVTVGGNAKVVVPNIKTANATVHLIDAVMLPPSG